MKHRVCHGPKVRAGLGRADLKNAMGRFGPSRVFRKCDGPGRENLKIEGPGPAGPAQPWAGPPAPAHDKPWIKK